MALDLRLAGRVKSRLAARVAGRRPARLLLAAGIVACAAGAAILMSSLSPMFWGSSDPSTISAPLTAPLTQAGDSAMVVAPSPSATNIVPAPDATRPAPAGPVDGATFEMIVPSIGYRALVREGVGSNILSVGPGHYAGTPWPGQPGNVGVAGHNTYWLSFNRLRIGDRVEIRTQHGLYVYAITTTRVADPNDRTILAPTQGRQLTLTTCYPLWAGAFATKRLIFTAREIGGVA
jgi:LPXTG-site transpeptidase (sortase) family protein